MKVVKLFVLLFLVICLSSCGTMTAWTLGDNDAYTGRIGVLNDNNVEIGACATWHRSDAYPEVFGAYGAYRFETYVNAPDLIPLDFIPDLKAQPFIDVQITKDFGDKEKTIDDRGFVGPGGGLIIQDFIVLKYQYLTPLEPESDADNKNLFLLGMTYQW